MFGNLPEASGLQWYEYRYLAPERLVAARLITFASVGTHNHFVLDLGGNVFNRSAPLIKLPAGASEDEELCIDSGESPRVALGERAFEIVLARKLAAGDVESKWFERHGLLGAEP